MISDKVLRLEDALALDDRVPGSLVTLRDVLGSVRNEPPVPSAIGPAPLPQTSYAGAAAARDFLARLRAAVDEYEFHTRRIVERHEEAATAEALARLRSGRNQPEAA